MDCLSNTYQEQSANWGGQVAPQSNKDVQFYDQGIARRTERDTMEKERFGENGVIGSSPAMRRILDEVKIVASTDSTVLIQGEIGTGKELIASPIHKLSRRCGKNFIRFNCAALPAGLIESALFGNEMPIHPSCRAETTQAPKRHRERYRSTVENCSSKTTASRVVANADRIHSCDARSEKCQV